jgi:hypothetical protein
MNIFDDDYFEATEDISEYDNDKLSVIHAMIDDLNNNFDYGCIINGKRYEDDVSKVDWSKYRTVTISEFKRNKIGVCWDFVNYQHYECKKNGINDDNYMLVCRRSNDPDDILTHTFTIVTIDDKKYWIESSRWKDRGVHEVRSYKDVVDKIKRDDFKNKPYDVYLFDPSGMDQRLTDQQYFDKATTNLIETSQKNNYHKIV